MLKHLRRLLLEDRFGGLSLSNWCSHWPTFFLADLKGKVLIAYGDGENGAFDYDDDYCCDVDFIGARRFYYLCFQCSLWTLSLILRDFQRRNRVSGICCGILLSKDYLDLFYKSINGVWWFHIIVYLLCHRNSLIFENMSSTASNRFSDYSLEKVWSPKILLLLRLQH